MLTIDEVNDILDDIMDELPVGIFDKLNGGVILSPEVKIHPEAKGRNDLYIMGEYDIRRGLGRSVTIYYGSFMQVYPNADAATLKNHLRDTLFHELTHHLETLAGERDLEIQDDIDLEAYRERVGIAKKHHHFFGKRKGEEN